MILKALLFVLFVLPIFTAGFLLGNLFPRKILTVSPTVSRIVDGNTLDLSDGRRLRLASINAPKAGEGTKYECLGAEAKERISALSLHQKISLQFLSRDHFGRIVIEAKNGDRWSCSAAQAQDSGFSLSSTCR